MRGWVDFGAVKRAVSLEAVLGYYGVRGLRRTRDRLESCCPIHGGQRGDSFRVSLSKNVFLCFACQKSGNVLDFVAAMERCSIREAALRLQEWFGVGGPPARGDMRERELVRKEEGGNSPLRFALTGVDPSIRNAGGETVAYAGRALDGGLPKYKLPAGFRKGLELFNLDRAAVTGSRSAIVVEGYFDCLRVHQAGRPWVVALMGSSLSAEQERMLLERFERIVLMLDGDTAGRAGSEAIAARLAGKCSVSVIQAPDGSQPDQLSVRAIQQLLDGHAVRA